MATRRSSHVSSSEIHRRSQVSMSENLTTCAVLIPRRSTPEQNAPIVIFEREVLVAMGGYTRVVTEVLGAWTDESGRVVEDPSLLYLVAIPRHPRATQMLSLLVSRLAEEMGEKCMLILLPRLSAELVWAVACSDGSAEHRLALAATGA